MNPQKEILDQYETLKMRLDKLSAKCSKKNRLNFKALVSKEYSLLQNSIMNYFNDLVIHPENIALIMLSQLDKKVWNLLIDRISKVLKNKIESSHLGKNYQILLNQLYSVIIEDLKTSFQFFRNVYSIIADYESKDCNILVSNILTFMGDIKKLKLTLNKKFSDFKDFISIEGDVKKDGSDALRFFNYALNNNPYNTRIYSNIGYVYREFLHDHQNSAYWFIRALSCPNNDLTKIKDNLEKDFNSVRKKFNKTDYIVNSDIGYMKYDLEHLPTLYYRIIGILYMNIDIDKIDGLSENFNLIMNKVLANYSLVPDNYKFLFEFNGLVEQMTILSIFNFHHNLNGLSDYSNDPEKIVFSEGISNEDKNIKMIEIYNHNLTKEIQKITTGEEIKNSFKLSLVFISNFIKSICLNMNEENQTFTIKFLLIIFYWLSLNYDVFNLLIDEEISRYLKFFNFVLKNEIGLILNQTTENSTENNQTLNNEINQIFTNFDSEFENKILPIETTFFGFIPMNRFFSLHKKTSVLRLDDVKEVLNLNKFTLSKFLDSFNLKAENDIDIETLYYKSSSFNVTEKVITQTDNISINASNADLKSKLFNTQNKNMINLNVKKVKPLILLDACNIAMRHGDKTFSTKGIQLVMDYFTRKGHKVLSFLPEYLFNKVSPGKKVRVVPDDIDYLKTLSNQGLVVQTPPQDYDDSYCIHYAKDKNAFIVTNDMYRDYLENVKDNRMRESERMWTKEKLVSFTFNKDEFIPNPDSGFFREFNIREYGIKNEDE